MITCSLDLPADQPLPRVVAKSVGLHPLLYRKRIERIDREARPGDLVAVYAEDRLAGYGLVNPKAEIAVRMLSLGDQRPDESWWRSRLETAVRLRREILRLEGVTDSYRVIHAESDGLPGLVVDKLGDVLSAECFSIGMYLRAEAILKLLSPLVGTKHTLIRTGPATLSQEGFEGPPIASDGLSPRVTIQEFGTRFRVDFAGGHKTGFFCDQRDNRRMLASFCSGKSVLDLCCYSGGFAIQAKKLGGAAEVTGVDLDEEPLALARENANLNQVRVRFVQADAFAYMRDMLANGRQYDVVVLDPPKLIRNRAELEEGTRKHFDLNRLAMQLVVGGGLMVSCTCAGLLAPDEFLRLIYAAARQAGTEIAGSSPPRRAARTCQILAKTGAAPDHPVAAHCPETEYLQAVWMRLV
ncbi:MAG TPA: class I SAM-dependent rRNA methyltransferase [Pirellulaceae bacterium]|nr:class I SAM-dependent rRNA methyltransferase [Pirellulaceae bacterium]